MTKVAVLTPILFEHVKSWDVMFDLSEWTCIILVLSLVVKGWY